MSGNGNHIRIKDIAARAGCSIGTVDRVIHKRGKVSEPVKKRILEILPAKIRSIWVFCCPHTKKESTGNYPPLEFSTLWIDTMSKGIRSMHSG